MSKLLGFFLLTALSINVCLAETKSILLGNDPVKIAILGMGTYSAVLSGAGLGAAGNISKEIDATDVSKAKADGFDFNAVAKHSLDQYKERLSEIRKWQVASAKEIGKPEAVKIFAQAVKDSDSKIPGTPSADRYKRWTLVDDLPFVDVQWVMCITCEDYQKAITEAAKKFCVEAGVDGVWLQSNHLSYSTKKGLSSFFSSYTGGSGQGTATVSVDYVLIDKEGQVVIASGTTAEQFDSEESFGMVGGMKAIDKEMMTYQLDAISVSAKEIAKKIAK